MVNRLSIRFRRPKGLKQLKAAARVRSVSTSTLAEELIEEGRLVVAPGSLGA